MFKSSPVLNDLYLRKSSQITCDIRAVDSARFAQPIQQLAESACNIQRLSASRWLCFF